MNDWLTESTRIFIDNLLKEDLGLGHSVSDGQTKTIAISQIEPFEPSLKDRLIQAINDIDFNTLSETDEKKLIYVLKELAKIR